MTIQERQEKILEMLDLKVGDAVAINFKTKLEGYDDTFIIIKENDFIYLKDIKSTNDGYFSLGLLISNYFEKVDLPKSYTIKDILDDIKERLNNPQYYDKNEIEKDIDILEFALEKIKDQIVELNKLKAKEENK